MFSLGKVCLFLGHTLSEALGLQAYDDLPISFILITFYERSMIPLFVTYRHKTDLIARNMQSGKEYIKRL